MMSTQNWEYRDRSVYFHHELRKNGGLVMSTPWRWNILEKFNLSLPPPPLPHQPKTGACFPVRSLALISVSPLIHQTNFLHFFPWSFSQ